MTDPQKNITLSQIANKAGVAISTVSYALRGDPIIPKGTTDLVRQVAHDLGYKMNPRVSELMSHIRRGRPVRHESQIAFIWTNRAVNDRYLPLLDGASQRAAQLGYGLSEFWLEPAAAAHVRLERILTTRGIAGLIICPGHAHSSFSMNLNWERFAAIDLGTARSEPPLSRSTHHHFDAMQLALHELQKLGCRRIVSVISPKIDAAANGAYSAAFVHHHPLRLTAHRFLQTCESVNAETTAWIKRVKPDGFIADAAKMSGLRNIGYQVPAGTPVALLDWSPNQYGYAGVDKCFEIIAANAVDLLNNQLSRNELGVPRHPQTILFRGVWRRSGVVEEKFESPNSPQFSIRAVRTH